MTQSPIKENTTVSGNKTLVKGVGYTTIFESDAIKFELTAQGSCMRRTLIQDGKEYLYEKVEAPEEIRKIERLSENWAGYRGRVRRKYNYIILEQRNAENKRTGYYKVVDKSKASVHRIPQVSVEANRGDWTYYKKRGRLTDEV